MSWQRPNIGSRMNREVHVRVWERAEVKFLRATRQLHELPRRNIDDRFTSRCGNPQSSQLLPGSATSRPEQVQQTEQATRGAAIPDRYFGAALGQMLVPLGPMPTSCTIVSPSLAAA